MPQVLVINNEIPVIKLKEVVIGSQFIFAVQFERLISENPDVYEPLDFTNMILKAEIKDRPAKEILADAEFVCIPRISGGWVDMTLDGEISGTLLERDYHASLKVWPTGFPEKGDTLLAIVLPMKYKATR